MKIFKPLLLLFFGSIQNPLQSQAPANHVLMMIKFRNAPFSHIDSVRKLYQATQLDSAVMTEVKLWAIPDSIANRYSGLSGTMSRIETSYNAQGTIRASTDSLATIRLTTITPGAQSCFSPQFSERCVSNPSFPVKIAVIDSGIDTAVAAQNEDLSRFFNKTLSRNFSTIGANANDLLDLKDRKGHGTVISHIIAQVLSKNGLFGVTRGQEIIMLRIFDSSGYASQWGVVKALDYAIAQNVKIINMSINWTTKKHRNSANPTILSSIFAQLQANSILVVASSGNNGRNLDRDWLEDETAYMPANIGYDGQINPPPLSLYSVAATNCRDSLGYFSNFGATSVPAAALGVNIPAIDHTGTWKLFTGTSMSSAIVAGLAAAKVSRIASTMSNSALKDALRQDCGINRPQLTGMVQFGITLLSDQPEINPGLLNLKILSNPVSDAIHLKFDLNSTNKVQMQLRDGSGRMIKMQTIQGYTGENVIEWRLVQTLPSGFYVLTLQFNQTFITRKIMVF